MKWSVFAFSMLFASTLLGAPANFTYQGQIIKPSGQALEGAAVTFTIEVLSPAPSECVLYEEQHILNMSNSNGIFAIEVGTGTQSGADYEDVNSLTDAINNSIGSITPTTCVVGPNYNPASTDGRQIRVTFDDGSGPVTVSQNHQVKSVPYADSASAIDGLASADILQINTGGSFVLDQANLEWIFTTNARYTELQALINGTSTQYLTGTPTADLSMNSNKITDLAAPTNANDATNKNYVDSNIGGVAADTATIGALAPGNAGEVMTWNGTQWTSGVPAGDSTKLPLAGGTMTGSIDMGTNNITNANNLAATTTSTTNLAIVNGDASFMGFVAPAGSADLYWTLPAADGGAGQILSTNGSGVLSWVTDSAPVDDVFGRTGNVVATAGDYDANQVDNTAAGNIAATDVQAAINELDTEKVAKAGDNMTGALTMDAENEIRFADNDDSHYVGFKAPATIAAGASFVWELPDDDGANGEVLQTNGAGVLSFVAIPTAPVTDVFGRTGNVVAQASDYDANQVDNTPAGNIAATDVQAAINELDTEKVNVDYPGYTDLGAAADNADTFVLYDSSATALREVTRAQLVLSEAEVDAYANNNGYVTDSRTITAGVGLSGGGDLSANRTIDVDINSETAETTVNAADELLIYDDSATAIRKMTRANFVLSEAEVDAYANNNGYGDILDGGNTEGAAVTIGTNDNFALNFETNNSTAMTIDNSGNVGIGTNSPSQMLHVAGNSWIGSSATNQVRIESGLIRIHDNLDAGRSLEYRGTKMSIGQNNGRANSANNTSLLNVWSSSDSAEIFSFKTNTENGYVTMVQDSPNTFNMNFVQNSVTQLYLKEDGNVGIASTSPRSLFEVAGDIQIGSSAAACVAAKAGAMRYTGGNVEFCNGTAWQAFGTAAGGEVNTASNQGAGGVGVFDTKNGVDLEFKNINNGSEGIAIANDAGNTEVDISLDVPGITDLGAAVDNADSVIVYDASGTALREATRAELVLSEAEVDAYANNNGYAAGARNLTAGAGLTGGGDLTADRTFDVGAGDGISVAADSVAVDIPGTTDLGAAVDNADSILVYDASGTALREATRSELVLSEAEVDAYANNNGYGDIHNNGDAGAIVLGSNDNTLSLEANNSVAMTITTAGDVGVNSATPRSKFEVVGDIQIGSDAAACVAAKAGAMRYTGGNVEFCNGTVWQAFGTAAGGEVNTASNQGAGGVGVFDTKNGVDFEFKNINNGSEGIAVANDAGNTEIDISLDIPGVTDLGAAADNADTFLVYDTSGTALREVTRAQVVLSEAEVDAYANNNGYVADSRTITAGVGLSGGGDLSANRTIDVDINSETAETTVNAADELLIYDDSATAIRKMTRANFVLSEAEVDAYANNNGYGDILDGGNTEGAAVTIGTNDNFALNFETNNTTALTIDTSQDATFAGDVYASRLQDPTFTRYLGFNATGVVRLFSADTDIELKTNNSDDILLTTNNNERVRVLASGNVGVASASPRSLFEVAGDIQIGSSAAACVAAKAGAMRYTGGNVEFCNGTSWQAFGTAAGGEVNTASNQGAGGVGVFDTKNGVDFEFKNINNGSEGIAIANDAGNTEIDISLDIPGVTDLGAAADNADTFLVYDTSGTALREVTRAQVVLSEAEVDAYANNNGYGDITGGSSIGTGGVDVYRSENSGALEFATINNGSEGISIGDDVVNDEVDISIDIPGVTDLGATAANADSLILYDASGTALREVTRSQLVLSEAEVDAYANNNGYGDILDGGNTEGAAVTIGTNDNFALNFETNGTNQMTIQNDGRVGIGGGAIIETFNVSGTTRMSASSAPLEVMSNQNTNDTRNVARFARIRSDATSPGANMAGVIELELEGFTNGSQVDGATFNWGWEVAQTNNTTDRDSYFAISTTQDNTTSEAFRINSAGNVGIGTDAPAAKLDVSGQLKISGSSSATSLAIDPVDGTDEGAQISLGGAGIYGDWTQDIYRNRLRTIAGGAGTSILQFYSASGSLESNFAGKVTVGSLSSPGTALDIDGVETMRGMAAPTVSLAGQGRIYFDSTANKYRVSENGGAYTDLVGGGGTGDILDGGNTEGAAVTIGTNDAFNLNFEANNAIAMTVENGGDVGIGTTNPLDRFHVNGHIRADDWIHTTASVGTTYSSSGASIYPMSGAATSSQMFIQNTSTTDSTMALLRFAVQNTSTNQQNAYVSAVSGSGAGVYSPSIVFGQQTGASAYSERMRIDTSGNVGIGTDAPAVELDVHTGTINAAAICDENNANCLDLNTFSPGSGDILDGGNTEGAAVTIGTNDNFALNFETNNSTAMTIDNAGNVGIGSATPTEALDVVGGIAATQRLSVVGSSGSTVTGLEVINTHAGTSGPISAIKLQTGASGVDRGIIVAGPEGSSTTGFLSFRTRQAGAMVDTMRINSLGNVGIGTDSPGEKLDVEGSILSGPKGATAGDGGAIKFEELAANIGAGGIEYVGFRAPDSIADGNEVIWELPAADGTSGQVLQTNGSGVLSWTSMGSGDLLADGSVAMTDSLELAQGALGTGGVTFTGDLDTGIHRAAVDEIAIDTAGSERIRIDASGHVGIGNASPDVELDVTGDIEYSGTLTDVSDRRLKDDIMPLEDSLGKVLRLQGVSFVMKDDESRRKEIGVIAQEVEEVMPELVHTANDEMESKSVNYIGFIGYIIESIKELSSFVFSKNAEQDRELASLKKQNEDLMEIIKKQQEQIDKIQQNLSDSSD